MKKWTLIARKTRLYRHIVAHEEKHGELPRVVCAHADMLKGCDDMFWGIPLAESRFRNPEIVYSPI